MPRPCPLPKGKFSDRPIRALCTCEQKRNTSTVRNALGLFPDECILAGIDKILCYFGISDIYEWMSHCPLVNDCDFLSKSLSSLSDIDLDCTPYKCECLYLNNNLTKIPSSESEFEFLSACSRLDFCEPQPSCPPCKELPCKRSKSPKKQPSFCERNQKSLKLMCSNFQMKGKKDTKRTVSKIGNAGSFEKCSFSAKTEKCNVYLCPPPKQKCSCKPERKRPASTSSDRSSGSFSFKVTYRPVSPCSPRKAGGFEALPTINSASCSKETESLSTKPPSGNTNTSDTKKKPPLKIESRPKIVYTKWALTRVNIFDDCSKTYEIMDLKKKIPKGTSAGRTQLFFAVLPDGTTCSYDCLGEVKTK